ncbi:POU domain class 2-associating factor 2 [Osmerus mordax]|uniref:POU domain class 2-associating factor 2 n=1 Tax=Osmerus mordax TaxID=8014 RepID=UPI00350EA764
MFASVPGENIKRTITSLDLDNNAMETEYSKRVYQGVRVKHTVKDLLAEKRLRQTNVPRFNAGTSHSQQSFVQMPGSHMLPSYYSMRRPFLTDSELCPSAKQYTTDPYTPALGSKGLSYDHPSAYPSFIDSYYTPETFGDYRGATAISASGGGLFPPSALPHLLPPLSGEAPHLLRDTWEHSEEDSVSQSEVLCSEGPVPSTGSHGLTNPDPKSPSSYRMSTGRSVPTLSSPQPYSLHPLEEVHYSPSSYAPSSNYSSSYSYMTAPGESAGIKIMPVTSEDSSDAVQLSNTSWTKEDAPGSWLPYEPRKAY